MSATPEAHVASPAAVSESGVAENGGVWLSWRVHGSGEPVLLIMGFMGSSRAWFRLLPHLARRHRAIVFDNRGTGDSDRPLGVWSMHDLAGDALAVLDAAGHESAHVIGVSMGGMIAQRLALDHPERVRSLALCCTHAGPWPLRTPWRMAAAMALRPLLGAGRTLRFVAPLHYSERTRREQPERLDEDVAMRVDDATPIATAPGQFAAMAGHDVRDELPRLSLPVLVVHGSEDRVVPVDRGRELARLIPGARLHVIPRCGHILATDAEDEIAALLLDFLAEHARAAVP